MRRFLIFSVLLVLGLGLAYAQEQTSGTLEGVVAKQDGTPIDDAIVTAMGPQGVRTTTTDKESRMAETANSYKQVRIEDAITDAKTKMDLSALDKPWQPERARFKMASRLAYGLLGLFALTIACSGIVITTLVVTSVILKNADILITGMEQMLRFITTLLPYIATPLGVALILFQRTTE